MNKKGQVATDTPILIWLVVFQAFIITMLGLLNITPETQSVGIANFTQNIITNLSILGWGNLLIFLPLEIALGYIIAKLIRGGG